MWSFEACRDHLLCFLSSGSMCGWRRHCREISRSSPQHSLVSRASFCGKCAEHIWTMLNGSPRPETKQIIITFVIAFSRRLVTYEWGLLQQNGAGMSGVWQKTLALKIADLPQINYHIYGKKKASYEDRSQCFFFLFCIIDEIISNSEIFVYKVVHWYMVLYWQLFLLWSLLL